MVILILKWGYTAPSIALLNSCDNKIVKNLHYVKVLFVHSIIIKIATVRLRDTNKFTQLNLEYFLAKLNQVFEKSIFFPKVAKKCRKTAICG